MTEPHNPETQPPEQVLDRPVIIGDFNAELKKTKRGFGKVTLGLAGAVVLVAAFFGGVATHAAIAKPAASSSNQQNQPRGNGNRQFPGGGQNGQNGQNAPGARGTIGTIDHVDGADVYVKTQDGRTVKVSTSDSTRIRISQDGKVSDLKPGSQVAVQGSTGSDGTVTAQTITEGQFARGGQ